MDAITQLTNLLERRIIFIDELQTEMEDIPLEAAFQLWRNGNQLSYNEEFDILLDQGTIPSRFADGKPFTIGGFRHVNHTTVLSALRSTTGLTEDQRRATAQCYSNFINWLNEVSCNWFKRQIPTYRLSLHAIEQTLSISDWRTFIDTLCEKNERDALIARCLLQGEKRISDVLKLTLKQINFEKNTITYQHRKQTEVVTHEENFMQELKDYIKKTNDIRGDSNTVFVTRNGKSVTRARLNHSFAKACKEADIKNISPDSLRGIYKIFMQQGYTQKTIVDSKKQRLKSKVPAVQN